MRFLQAIITAMILMASFSAEETAQTVRSGEQFILKTGETAKIVDTDIEITVKEISHSWTEKGGSVNFSFTVRRDGKTAFYLAPLPPSITAGDYKIEVLKTDPFGYGSATFIVNKKSPNDVAGEDVKVPAEDAAKDDASNLAAAKFVEKFGWHIDKSVTPVKVPIEFPKNFDGLPFYHYQSVSKASGVDMTPLLGRKMVMLRYTLVEKQKDREQDYTIYAHLVIEKGVVVGAWRTDSSDRTPGIYSFVKKKI